MAPVRQPKVTDGTKRKKRNKGGRPPKEAIFLNKATKYAKANKDFNRLDYLKKHLNEYISFCHRHNRLEVAASEGLWRNIAINIQRHVPVRGRSPSPDIITGFHQQDEHINRTIQPENSRRISGHQRHSQSADFVRVRSDTTTVQVLDNQSRLPSKIPRERVESEERITDETHSPEQQRSAELLEFCTPKRDKKILEPVKLIHRFTEAENYSDDPTPVLNSPIVNQDQTEETASHEQRQSTLLLDNQTLINSEMSRVSVTKTTEANNSKHGPASISVVNQDLTTKEHNSSDQQRGTELLDNQILSSSEMSRVSVTKTTEANNSEDGPASMSVFNQNLTTEEHNSSDQQRSTELLDKQTLTSSEMSRLSVTKTTEAINSEDGPASMLVTNQNQITEEHNSSDQQRSTELLDNQTLPNVCIPDELEENFTYPMNSVVSPAPAACSGQRQDASQPAPSDGGSQANVDPEPLPENIREDKDDDIICLFDQNQQTSTRPNNMDWVDEVVSLRESELHPDTKVAETLELPSTSKSKRNLNPPSKPKYWKEFTPQWIQLIEKYHQEGIRVVDTDKLAKNDPKVLPMGMGVFASREFKKWEFVCEYRGELINKNETKRRKEIYDKDPKACFVLQLNSKFNNQSIDATPKEYFGCRARYINHSIKHANLEFACIKHNGIPRAVLYAKHDIPSNTQLFYSYGERDSDILRQNPFLKH